MAEYQDREAFIPYRKADVIELCVEDGKLDEVQQKKFREFCEILGAYYHFEFHELLEKLKNNFAPFNPDADTRPRVAPTSQQLKTMENDLVDVLRQVLKRANYSELTKEALEHALDAESLITLKMDVDFDDYEQMVFFHRGDSEETVQIKKMFKKIDFTMEMYERVVLLIKFKDEEYFKQKGAKISKLNFTPGKTYVYMYKSIPKADIEVLFPNVQIGMNFKDKLMLGLPAIGAGIAMIPKLIPTIIIITGLVIAMITGKEALAKNDVMQGVIAALSLLAVMGGFLFKQYVKYKNKRIEFLKSVTDTLFFKNLDCNGGVFNMLIDAAEEEESKEVILAYYHLLTNPQGLDQEELDNTIEEWLEKKFQAQVDFDVDKAVKKLEKLVGKLEDDDNSPDVNMLEKGQDNKLKVRGIDDSKTIIDYVWDNIFQYND
ncbi:TMEM143 family protein [Candidatus Uabimicrobium sp. HlEnr_7]|uniref:TMEM143 family protein n=1 Tax=Candidatus Uabimicrobium helgolandensis TaxID=3095367 RepID=UPI003557D22D